MTSIEKNVGVQQMRGMIARAEKELRRDFLRFLRMATGQEFFDAIVREFQTGSVEAALGMVDDAFAQFSDSSLRVYTASGAEIAEAFSQGAFALQVRFDQTHTRAVAQMQQAKLRLIREFSLEQRAAVREALTEGVRLGSNPREQARAFRSSIGLTRRQVRASNNFRRLLEQGSAEALTRQLRDRRFDSSVRRAVAGEALTPSHIDRMVSRYQERFLAFRARTISRTEALRAVHEANQEVLDQGIDNGVFERDQVIQEWHPAADSRVRDHHASMRRQRRPLGEPFLTGQGNLIRFPGDINAPASETIQCRCAVSTRIDAGASSFGIAA